MSSNGGVPYGSDEPTSFGLQAPQSGVPYPGNPYAQPPRAAQAAPGQAPAQSPTPPTPTQVVPQPSQAPPDPGAGRLIADRYRLLAKLGHGGMGTVWRAKDEKVDREVAIKEPRVPDHLPERERANAAERMRREARAAARLDHPAVVQVYDVAIVDGQPWIVMELVQGRSLGDVLQEGTLGVREAARIGLEVLGALEAAHAAGILHRDVKPDNVLLGRHDRVVLTDFGIAQIEGETNLTDTGGFVGSPEYIAPERVLGQRPGPAADIWSLGVVLYAATEGVSPFRRTNTPATLQSVLNATPAAPASASGPLADAINGVLHKDPAQRLSAAQVRTLLESAAKPPAPEPTQVVQLAADPGAGSGSGGKSLRVGRKALFSLGAAVVAAAVAAYLVIANPFAGPLPDSWKRHTVKDLDATVAVPSGYTEVTSDPEDEDEHWVRYQDPSGALYVRLELLKKSEDEYGSKIAGSAMAQAYAEAEKIQSAGSSAFRVAEEPAPKVDTREVTYKEQKAAESTAVFTDDSDSDEPLPLEIKIFYYKTQGGDMYRMSVRYPGKGDFTERGREVARTAIANLDVDKL
ncbi:serine/threonine-protein kinase [Streptomyces sp. NPDC002845]